MPPVAASAPAAAPSANAPANGDLAAQLESLVRGVLSLDPQEAAIRAGLTLLVVLGALLALVALRLGLKAIAARISPDGEDAPKNGMIGAWTLPIVRLAVAVGAGLMLLHIWGIGLAEVMAGPMGRAMLTAGRMAVTIAVVFAAIEISQLAIRRVFSNIADRTRGPRRAAQLRTIAPVVSGVVTTVLLVIGAMMVLGQVGVEIGPLIAGAGIVGLAVGFGAQTLVKDFLTGLFLIVEDSVSIGDVVRIGASSGLVEDMSLRTIKLRDFDGTLHVIPYGEAQTIHNMTKGFAFAVFDLTIAHSADLLRALEVMQSAGEQLRQDPAFSSLILEPIEILGVDKVSDTGVMLKARIKTLPIKQWAVRREYLKRVKLAFDAAGIEAPSPQFKLSPPDQAVAEGDAAHPRAAE